MWGFVSKRFLVFFTFFCFSTNLHTFNIIETAKENTKSIVTLVAKDIAKLTYVGTCASLGEYTIASLLNKTKPTLINWISLSKKSRLLAPKLHLKIYTYYVHDFLRTFLPHFDIDAKVFIDNLSCDCQTKNQYKNVIYKQLETVHGPNKKDNSIDSAFKNGFSQYKKQNKYYETIKANVSLDVVASILIGGSLLQLAAETSIHTVSQLSSALLTPYNNNLYVNSLNIIFKTLFPQEKNDNGSLLWRYGFKSSEKTINHANLIGIISSFGINLKLISDFDCNSSLKTVIISLQTLLFYTSIRENLHQRQILNKLEKNQSFNQEDLPADSVHTAMQN
jgi:hypothetical protein